MANNTDAYNPIFYAQEALALLEQTLGMARRVHRGYDMERKSFNKGDTIQIRQPGTFASTVGGTSTAQDVTPKYIQLTVDQWRQVRFGLTDKELAYTTSQIINEHISPAVYRLALDIETSLTDLKTYVPWYYACASSTNPAASDIINARKVLRDQAGAMMDTDEVHFAVDSYLEAKFLNLGIFHQAQIAGQQAAQQAALMKGHMGTRFGIEHFVQQTHAAKTAAGTVAVSDTAGTLSTAVSVGDATIAASFTVATNRTLTAGDTLIIAGNSQRYAITETATSTAGVFSSISIWPKAVAAYDASAIVTIESLSANNADQYNPSLMFHKNAFAFATAPLPEIGDGAGAKMAVVTDPRTGLSIRSRVGYDDKLATVNITLDMLYGVLCIEPNLAVVVRRDY